MAWSFNQSINQWINQNIYAQLRVVSESVLDFSYITAMPPLRPADGAILHK